MCDFPNEVRVRHQAIGHRPCVAAEHNLATVEAHATMNDEQPLLIDVPPDLAAPGTGRPDKLHIVPVDDGRTHG